LLKGKNIIVGICGSIAAYKAAILVRLLVKSGADVQVIMTSAAQDFITPLTLATLSKRPVLTKFVANEDQGSWNNHVELGLWADLILIAPASAYSLSKFANGICNDLLSAVYLSARCPVFVAPAMDLDMYQHPSTRHNLRRLKEYGNFIIKAESGELASGLSGQGRMAEPEHIIQKLKTFFDDKQPLSDIKVLLTAGPTLEAIDPVRFIGNASSGKMGYALAASFARQGASVVLVSGPTYQQIKHVLVEVIHVRSASEMHRAAELYFHDCQIAVFAAAVSDYRPAQPRDHKIKKKEAHLTLELVKTLDIAKSLSTKKKPGQFTVGFALETNDEESNAAKKLKEKNFDMIVLNSLNDPGAGFGYNTNQVKILLAGRNDFVQIALKSKQEVAENIVRIVTERYHA
jgi:phosphopantothenoylcysteine decarboxylase / phosphopantothenate---cysteine ligase